jgi:zinc protease
MKTIKYLVIIILLFCINNIFAQKQKTYRKYKPTYHKKSGVVNEKIEETTESAPTETTLDRTKLPINGPAPIIKIGKVENFTLANGLKVYVVKNTKLPRVAFNLVLDRDPLLEGEYAGLTQAVGDLLSTGTKNRTKDQFDEETDFIGASLNTTSTGIYASSLKKHSEKLLDLMSDIILNPNFTQSELDKIKKQMKSGLATAKDNPDAIANKVSQVLLFGKDHPYGEQMTNATVDKINLEVCNNYYKTYFRPNIGYLAVVGDITVDEAKILTEKHLSSWQHADVPKMLYSTNNRNTKTKVIVVDRPNSVQSVISIVNAVDLKIGSPEAIKARITNDILGGNDARLFNNLREKHGYTYGANSYLSADKLIGKFSANASVRNTVTDSSVAEMMKEIKGMLNSKPSEDELNKTKNAIEGLFVFSLEKPQTVADFAINTARYNLPGDYYTNYLKNVEATSAEDIQAMAQSYFKPENCYIIVVGKASEIAEKLKKFGEIEYYDVEGNKIDAPVVQKANPVAITAQNILEKYLMAIGGKEKIASVNNIELNYTGNFQDGTEIATKISKKVPNKCLQEVIVRGNVMQKTVIDGIKGVTINNGQESALKDTELKQAIAKGSIFYEQDPQKYGLKAVIKGVEKINEVDCNKIEYTIGDAKWIEYFDINSGLKVKSAETRNSPNGELTTTISYSNYKEINGIKFPSNLIQTLGALKIELNLESVKINKVIDDKLFSIK